MEEIENFRCTENETPTAVADCITSAMTNACRVIPLRNAHAHRPWISETTIRLIDRRNAARCSGQYELEKTLNRDIKRSAKHDRQN